MKQIIALVANDAGPKNYLSSFLDCRIDSKEEYVFEYFDSMPKEEAWDKIKLVVTGTSFGECIDKEAVRTALEKTIPVVSVIDHWSWYRKRFEVEKGGLLLLPNRIIVNDEIAYAEAISDGLPKEKLITLGNPVLERMCRRSRMWNSNRKKIKEDYEISSNRKLFVFISEEIRNDLWLDSCASIGYDEYQVVKSIVSILSRNHQLLIKLHPSEPVNKYSYIADKRVRVIRDINVEGIAAIGDVIIGMNSMLLLELAMFRQDIISFRPFAKRSFIGTTIGACVDANSIAELEGIIAGRKIAKSNLKRRFDGSTEKILRYFGSIVL
jgi:hypothetical protein